MSLTITKDIEVLQKKYGMEECEETFTYMAYTDHKCLTLRETYLLQPAWADRNVIRSHINHLEYWIIDKQDDLRYKGRMSESSIDRARKEIAQATQNQSYWLAQLKKIGRK